ncbi:hypothetical protein C7123_09380 [Tannerella serpentiformis]|nr:hypothetical protein BCB71_01965 [Tannerella serpentiformis]AVV53891.1 hypothetical protein C7123_09380 [Tannerella serpentiformis]
MPLLSALGTPIEYAFGLRQASAEAEEVCLVQEMTGICPVPGQTSPAAAAAPKQAPVYHCADCVAPNRRLSTLAQIA